MRPHRSHAVAMSIVATGVVSSSLLAADCRNTSVGAIPLPDLATGLYLGEFQGGPYLNGQNFMPPAHAAAGINRGLSIVPRNLNGVPSPNGSYVLLSIGMSNTTQEFCSGGPAGCAPFSFIGQAEDHPSVDHDHLAIVDGAAGGQTAATWDSPSDDNYDRVRDQVLAPQGLSEPQVQALWIKVANAQPTASLPAADADAFTLLDQLGDIARAVHVRYPNLRQAFLSSRIYGGYGSTPLNPEPFAYESGFAVKWLIQAQIVQMQTGLIHPIAGNLAAEGPDAVAPWLAWGPYLWADGTTPSDAGLSWNCADFANDGTHPSPSGREKVADLLMEFMLASPFTTQWFLGDPPLFGDLNGDDVVDGGDLGILLGNVGPCDAAPASCPGDLNGDGFVNGADLGLLLGHWS